MQAVLVNTAGGVTGGDEFELHIKAERNAHLTVTTQACERAYRAQPGETGRIRNRLRVAAGGRLRWLPQETILFDRCALDRALDVEMDDGASLLLAEPMIFGRTEMGETVRLGRFRDRIGIRRAGRALYHDAIHLDGDIDGHLGRPAVANGARAVASVIYAAHDAMQSLQTTERYGYVRPDHCRATPCRAMDAPTSWHIAGRPACG